MNRSRRKWVIIVNNIQKQENKEVYIVTIVDYPLTWKVGERNNVKNQFSGIIIRRNRVKEITKMSRRQIKYVFRQNNYFSIWVFFYRVTVTVYQFVSFLW